ncbi:hypothetical protein [Arachidicoccus ginsenosidimutans]|uniref:hypothetical protein n=1 Tax=Arachidicoccus sp. BS20 TaxID=1850526 RepID=UPI0012E7B1CF|nr:hypothetical protein [Arachidicoccus sp. BS20]
MAVAASIAAIVSIGLFLKLQAPKNEANVVAVNEQKRIPHKDSLVVPANKVATIKDIAPPKKENDAPKKLVHRVEQKQEEQIKNTVALVSVKKEDPKENIVAAIDSSIQPKTIVIKKANSVALNNSSSSDVQNQPENIKTIESSTEVNNTENTVAINSQPQQTADKKRKGSFFSKMLSSIKDKAKDVSESVYNEDENSATINVGFVSITKYKKQ